LWLELLREDCGILLPALPVLLEETGALLGIFTTIVSRVKRSDRS
jgi:hypothetical protein